MTTTPPLTGVMPVLQYPVQTDGALDVPALKREIDFVFASGCSGVTLAMVSEVTRLTLADRLALSEEVVSLVAGRLLGRCGKLRSGDGTGEGRIGPRCLYAVGRLAAHLPGRTRPTGIVFPRHSRGRPPFR